MLEARGFSPKFGTVKVSKVASNTEEGFIIEPDSKIVYPTTAERIERLQKESNKIQAANPTATKTAIAEMVRELLLKEDPMVITKKGGKIYPTSTIERLIKLMKTSRTR